MGSPSLPDFAASRPPPDHLVERPVDVHVRWPRALGLCRVSKQTILTAFGCTCFAVPAWLAWVLATVVLGVVVVTPIQYAAELMGYGKEWWGKEWWGKEWWVIGDVCGEWRPCGEWRFCGKSNSANMTKQISKKWGQGGGGLRENPMRETPMMEMEIVVDGEIEVAWDFSKDQTRGTPRQVHQGVRQCPARVYQGVRQGVRQVRSQPVPASEAASGRCFRVLSRRRSFIRRQRRKQRRRGN